MAALIPPPDGGEVLPTSGRYCHHLRMNNSRGVPRGRRRTTAVPPGSVAQLERPCWRLREYRVDQPPAMSG